MKRVKLLSIIILLCASVPAAVRAQIVALASWNMAGLSGGGDSPFTPTGSNANVTVGGLTRGSGVTVPSGAAGNAWGGASFFDNVVVTTQTESTAISNNNYVTFSVTANSGNSISFTSIPAYNIRKSGTGPATMMWQYSTDGTTFTDIGTATIPTGANTTSAGNDKPAVDLTGISALQNVPAGTTVTFRLVMWVATADAGTWYFNGGGTTIANRTLSIMGTMSTSAPLPLTLLSFKGQQVQGINHLNWVTTQEKNLSYFELERSTDGSHFSKIAQINSVTENGNDADNQYSYEDNNAAPTSFYRLKMIDVNGAASYSNIVVLHQDAQQENNITLYPNPVAEGTLFIEGLKGASSYRITDITGKEIISTTPLNTTDGNVASVNVSSLHDGVYFVQLKNENGMKTIRFVKK